MINEHELLVNALAADRIGTVALTIVSRMYGPASFNQFSAFKEFPYVVGVDWATLDDSSYFPKIKLFLPKGQRIAIIRYLTLQRVEHSLLLIPGLDDGKVYELCGRAPFGYTRIKTELTIELYTKRLVKSWFLFLAELEKLDAQHEF